MSCLLAPDLIVKQYNAFEREGIPRFHYWYYYTRNVLLFGKRFAPGYEQIRKNRLMQWKKELMGTIKDRAPGMVEVFELLFRRAISDAQNGVEGHVTL